MAYAFVLLLPLLASCISASSSIAGSSPYLSWRGRHRVDIIPSVSSPLQPLHAPSSPSDMTYSSSFDWAALSFRFAVSNATAASAVMDTHSGDATLRLRVAATPRNSAPTVSNTVTVSGWQTVELITGLTPNEVWDIVVMNIVDPSLTYTTSPAVPSTLLEVTSDGDFTPASPSHSIKMMFIGDETLSGAGALGPAPCTSTVTNSDASVSMATLLCDDLNTECLGTIAIAGRGLLTTIAGSALPTVPQLFLQLFATGNFTSDNDQNNPTRPDVIVVNVGTVDYAQARNASFNASFIDTYTAFIIDLNRVYYSAYPTIFVATGPMTHAYDAAAAAVVQNCHAAGLMRVFLLDLNGVPLDGCDGRPGVQGHAAMAAIAKPIIAAAMNWTQAHTPPAVRLDAVPYAQRAQTKRQMNSTLALHNVTFTVRSDGSGDFTSVQAALDACNSSVDTNLGHVSLLLLGVFFERVVIPSSFRSGVTLTGQGAHPLESLVIFNSSGLADGGTWATHTMLIQASDVTIINCAIANNASGYDDGTAGQSVALHIDPTGDRFACFDCFLLGAQDTVYTGAAGHGLRSYFYGGYSNGSTDAWFGGSNTLLECHAINMSFTVTAMRGEPASAYLIANGTVTTPPGGNVLLGRPWGQISRVVFKNTWMSAGVLPRGWDDWGEHCPSSGWCGLTLYAEYNSTGPGAQPAARVPWSYQLNTTQAGTWTREAMLGDWNPWAAVASNWTCITCNCTTA